MLKDGNNDKALELLERLAIINPTDKSVRNQLDILRDKKNKKQSKL